MWDAENDPTFVGSSDVTGLPSYGSINVASKQFQFNLPTDTVGTCYNMTVYTDDGYDTAGPY